MSNVPHDNKGKGTGNAPPREDLRKSYNDQRHQEKPQPWNVEPIKQTTEPPPRPKR